MLGRNTVRCSIRRIAFASLALALAAGHAFAWSRSLVVSGIGGDASTFGDHVAIEGNYLAISNWDEGFSRFNISTATPSSRWNEPVTGCANGVDCDGTYVLTAVQTGEFHVYSTTAGGVLWQSLSLGGMGLDLAADGAFAAVSYVETGTNLYKVALFEKSGGTWSRAGTFYNALEEPYYGRTIDVQDLPDYGAIGGGSWTKRARLIIGSHEARTGGVDNAGRAYMYELSDNSTVGGDEAWVCTAYLTPETPTDGGGYASDVVLSGDYAFVAHRGDFDVGTVDVWAKNSNGTWSISRTISSPTSTRYFGYSIAAYGGDHVLVGATSNNGGSGAAYLYERNGAGDWVLLTTLTAPSVYGPFALTNSLFGKSVALGNQKAAVGGCYASSFGVGSVFTIPEW
jgi:hypothetical protein